MKPDAPEQNPIQHDDKFIRNLKREVRMLRVGGDTMDLFNDPIPEEW